MRACVLASGSKGNVTYIETTSHKILIDLGTNVKNIKDKLAELDVLINDIDTVIISHIHKDHVSALESFIKKYKCNLYMTDGMIDELDIKSQVLNYEGLNIFNDDIFLDSVKIEIIKTSHDTKDSKGFIVNENGKSIVYITDTGYLNQKYFNKLKNKNLYLFESNHDVEMLMNGKYPAWLKDRVVGPYGHLSNRDASIYLAKLIGEDTANVVLMHLSEHNNTPEMALCTINDVFDSYGILFKNIVCAKQNEKSEVYNV